MPRLYAYVVHFLFYVWLWIFILNGASILLRINETTFNTTGNEYFLLICSYLPFDN